MYPKSRLLHLPQSVRYAVTGLGYLASHDDGSFRLVGEVAQATGLPQSSLAKVLQKVARSGILESRRGPLGGYRMARDASSITMGELLQASEQDSPESAQCMVEARVCNHDVPCLLHNTVSACEQLLWDKLHKTRLSELANATQKRLSPTEESSQGAGTS